MTTEKEIEKKIEGRQVLLYYARLAKNIGKSQQQFLDSMELMNILDEFPFLENEVEHAITYVWTFKK